MTTRILTVLTVLAVLVASASLAAAASAKNAPPLSPAASAALSAQLSTVVGVPTVCYTSLDAYFTDTPVPAQQFYVGIAGVYAFIDSLNGMGVGLTPAECLVLSRRNTKNWVFAMAVFVVAHERAHAHGQDYATWLAHQDDPAFAANAAEIAKEFPSKSLGIAELESGADCVGMQTVVAMARALGVPAKVASDSYLIHQAWLSGPYTGSIHPLPAYCLTQAPLVP